MEGVVYTGNICKVGANWGFIKCDDPEMGDVFCIPQACPAFGREMPPVGTQVQFTVVTDAKTGRPRAEGVEPCAGAAGIAADPSFALGQEVQYGQETQYAGFNPSPQAAVMEAYASQQQAAAIGKHTGTMAAINGNFGFIKPDAEGSDMFCLPPFPQVGARVSYDVVNDPKTGRLRAETVETLADGYAAGTQGSGPEQQQLSMALGSLLEGMQGDAASALFQELQNTAPEVAQAMGFAQQSAGGEVYAGGRPVGTMSSINRSETFGFIRQDNGEADMFTLPPFFPIGAKVIFDVIQDPKTGRPRAENVVSADGSTAPLGGPAGGKGCGFGQKGYGPAGGKGCGKSNFRSQPYGGAQGYQSAPVYQPPAALEQAAGQVVTGTIAKVNDKFGFITQDSGDSDMFVFPPACTGFGKLLPPVGTRVQYHVVMDSRTGRPRAEGVAPTQESFAQEGSAQEGFAPEFFAQDGGFAQQAGFAQQGYGEVWS